MNGTALVRNKIDELIWNSRREFAKRRWILLTNVQEGTSVEDLKQNFLQGLNVIDFRIKKNSAYVYILLATPDQALNAVNTLNGETFRGYVVGVCLAPPDSLVFVGNLPFEFTEEQFRNLMSPFGPIERLVLVHSFFTGESKGYGFVDYLNRECATQAKKQLTRKGSKYLGGRILRVDFAEGNLLTYEDLHSKTLFVDRLPRDFTNADMLRALFTQSGTVTFAQVALNQHGISRGFAFVDYMTAEEAERGQKAHNGALLINSHIRVAYGTPGRTGASILGGGGGPRVPLGPWPNVPTPNEAQGVDLSGVRAPRPLMSLGTEHSQQMQKGQSLKQPMPLMRPGQPSPRPMMGSRMQGPAFGGPHATQISQGVVRPLLGRPAVPRPLIRPSTGPRGFVGMGVAAPLMGARTMAPQGPMQPRPLMDFGERPGTLNAPDKMQVPPVAKEPTQQFTAQDTIPALMGDSVLGGGLAQATVDPGVFGQPVQPIAPQQQEVFSPPVQQPQGMFVPSQQQLGARPAVPQMVQPAPTAPVPPYGSTMPAVPQTPAASVIPQAQASVLTPAQPQFANSQLLYAAAPTTMPLQGMVPQVVPADPSQYQSGVLQANPSVATPAVPVAGQSELGSSSTPYAVPSMQTVAQGDPAGTAAVSSGYVMLPANSTYQSGYYAAQETQLYPMAQPQSTGANQISTPQPSFQLPFQAGTVVPTQPVSVSQPSVVAMATPQVPQYQWSQPVAPVIGAAPVSTLQMTQNAPLQGGGQLHQGSELAVSSQPVALVMSANGLYGQYQAAQQYPLQQAATPVTENNLAYYQQPQVQQSSSQQQTGPYSGKTETSTGATQKAYPSMTSPTGNENSVFSNTSVIPQHSAPPVVYSNPQPTQLVASGGSPLVNQKRTADGDTSAYGQQGATASYYEANKRLRF